MYPPWLHHRFGLSPLVIVPWGYQCTINYDHRPPEGIVLPGDPEMPEATTDWSRVLNIFKPSDRRWRHQAEIHVEGDVPKLGYLCYQFSGSREWRVRVRVGVSEFSQFVMSLSRQPTRVALMGLEGAEIPLKFIKVAPYGTFSHLESY